MHAIAKFKSKGIDITIESTNELVWGVSRWDYSKFGSKELSRIDDALRLENQKCMGKKGKGDLNVVRDALIALSSLNHDFFITADRCLFKSWKIVIESNEENNKALEQEYKIPKIIHRRTPKGVFQAIKEYGLTCSLL
jgi:hypothetical protein